MRAVDLRISSRTICLMSARRARRQARATTKRAARATQPQAMAAWTDTWAARNSAGTPATELTAATIGLAKLNGPPGALRCAAARWSGGSQRRSLKCSSEQTVAVAADNPRAMAALRIITEGAGLGRFFLAALSSGAAMPMTVAITISHVRCSAMSQVQAPRCATAHRAGPEFIASSLPRCEFRLASPTPHFTM